jgi:dihydropteroate synthase
LASRTYIRPDGRLLKPNTDQAVNPPPAIQVAARRDLQFAAAELIEREGDVIHRRMVSAEALLTGATSGQQQLQLERMRGMRPPVAGLALDRSLIMGIVNVTPDSFSDGRRYLAPSDAVDHALRLEDEGADILDIGGESTRPGSDGVEVDEECRRVLPVISALARRSKARLSIDTRKAEVMRRAALEGVHILNDVSALTHDANAANAAAETRLPVVLMHSRGEPRTMQHNPSYSDVVLEVYDWLEARVDACEQVGISRDRLIVDPGIGFGKTLAHNLALLGSLSIFHGLGCALLLGASRKAFIGKLSGAGSDDRFPGSLAAALVGVSQGVQILRVHDVAATRQALTLWQAAVSTS